MFAGGEEGCMARAGVTVGGDYTLLGRGSLGRRRRLDWAGGRLGWAAPG